VYYLHGRSGRSFALYQSTDGIHWDEGVYINRDDRHPDGYCHNCVINKYKPDARRELMVQYSIVYDGKDTNEYVFFVRPDSTPGPGLGSRKRADEPWLIHDSFAEFATGTLGAGGANLYVTRSGRIEMINRLDFNNDGHLDLFVSNDHNHVEGTDILIYWGRQNGPQSLMPPVPDQLPRIRLMDEIHQRRGNATRLPSDGGGRSILADLNSDGYPEIVFCNFKHNYTIESEALVYWNGPRGFDPQRRTELPTMLAGGVAAADFNQDGFVDLAFANRGNFERLAFVAPHGHLESYVYYNGPKGFDAVRRITLPTVTARDCVAGDLNGDAYPDLLFANNNLQEKSIYLYWGSADGFSDQRRVTWPSRNPMALHLADVNRDHQLDLIVLHKSGPAEILLGNGRGLDTEPWATLPAVQARRCAVADVNADGLSEIVVADGTSDEPYSSIYWGTADGYAASRRTQLPTLSASDVVVADFNRDGRLDVGFSNTTDGDSLDTNSYIYWQGPDGFSAADRCELLGFSPDSANASDLNNDGHQDLVLISHASGSDGRKEIDSFIYWGNASHHYSTASMTQLAHGSAVGIADLNQDGFVDVVGGSQGVVHWGGRDGFRPQPLGDSKLEAKAIGIADLNRDGYLDLAMPIGSRSRYVERGEKSEPTRGVVWWGGEHGFRDARRTVLELETFYSQSVNIADFNRDGYLDLIFPGLQTGRTHIFWGAEDGTYNQNRQVLFQGHNASTVEIADLNQDGWLDLIFGGGWDTEHDQARPTKVARILWGGAAGYALERSQPLEAFDSLEASVADLNQDGYLDIVFTNYHAYVTRSIPLLIYWGAAGGVYSESRRTALPAESSSALTIADLNQDSWLDLFVGNHVVQGDHTVQSNIFWGSPAGYSAARRHGIPTFGPHFGIGRDVGNLYDRQLAEQYTSAALACPSDKSPSRLEWTADTPHGTAIKFQIRSGRSRTDLERAKWHGPNGADSHFDEASAALDLPAEDRWFQYRAILTTPDGGSTPALRGVAVRVRGHAS
ncbi:MAG: FG-GAP repeat domain-containing protein, partial [Pirellulaceae bacterium]